MPNKYEVEIKKYKGQTVEFNRMPDGTAKIIRVISTDPKVYLNKEFQPGIIIDNYKFK